MNKVVVLTFLLNLALLHYTYAVAGPLIAVALAAGLYLLLKYKLPHKPGLTIKLPLAVVHLLGAVAINSLLHQPLLTLVAVIGELSIVLIFLNLDS